MEIDYKETLIKYIRHIIDSEGTDYIAHHSFNPNNDEEMEKYIKELYDYFKNK